MNDPKDNDKEIPTKSISEKNGNNNEKIVFESNEEDTALESRDLIRKLQTKLKECESLKREYLLGWQRMKADFINIRKKDEKIKNEFVKFAKEDMVMELMPVLESFEMAFSNKEMWEKVSKDWRMGVEHIFSQLIYLLENNNVKQINPKGEKFDPRFHESVGTVETQSKDEDDVIVNVVQKGYILYDKVLKSAKVKVARYTVS